MNCTGKWAGILTGLAFMFSSSAGAEPGQAGETRAPAVATEPIARLLESQALFVSGTRDTHTFRIPALITAANGDLIAACDARRAHGRDLIYSRDIDIAVRRSADNGKTWSEMELICDFGDGRPASDPSLILDRDTGEIFCFYNYMDQDNAPKEFRLYVQSSRDHGRTWGEARDITDQIARPEWKMDFKFITSGRGIQLASGALLHTLVNLENGLHLFGSTDHGRSWRLLDVPIEPGNESKVIELADGRWMVNCRVNGHGFRWVHVSDDNGQTWAGHSERRLVDPGCNGSILRYTSVRDGYARNRLLFCNANSAQGRNNLSARISYDEGETWSDGKVIDPGPSAYSSLTVCRDGTIGVLYEPGHQEVRFARFTLEDLTDGSDRLSRPYRPPGEEATPSLSAPGGSDALTLPVREPTTADRPGLLPMPQTVTWAQKAIPIPLVRIAMPPLASTPLKKTQLVTQLKELFGGNEVEIDSGGTAYPLILRIGEVEAPCQPDEAYRLRTDEKGIEITANTVNGLFYGVQTLRQLLVRANGRTTVAACEIHDYPAFQIRGFMHDVGRNFQPLEFLRPQVDGLRFSADSK